MPKKTDISKEDMAIFREAVAGIRLIQHNKIHLNRSHLIIQPHSVPHQPPPESEYFHFSSGEYLDPVKGDEFIGHRQNGIADKTFRKLRKGQYTIDATLDLHKLSVQQARVALNHLLQQCLQKKQRMILIIHGKGHYSQTPILKNKLNHWLRETTIVLAFCSAAPIHGGRGATYVLLKRLTEENVFE